MELRNETDSPDETTLRRVLGSGYAVYERMLAYFADKGLTHEWRYYHDGKAWLCKVQKGTRTMVWMSAWRGYIQATVYILEKHREAVYSCGMSEACCRFVRDTPNVGRSKPCVFRGDDSFAMDDFRAVVEFKMAHK